MITKETNHEQSAPQLQSHECQKEWPYSQRQAESLLQGMWTAVRGESGTNYHFGHKSVSFNLDKIKLILSEECENSVFAAKTEFLHSMDGFD